VHGRVPGNPQNGKWDETANTGNQQTGETINLFLVACG